MDTRKLLKYLYINLIFITRNFVYVMGNTLHDIIARLDFSRRNRNMIIKYEDIERESIRQKKYRQNLKNKGAFYRTESKWMVIFFKKL